MKKTLSIFNYGFIYAKNYLLETLAIFFPKISWLVPKPLYVGLSVGTICNLRCQQCDLWRMKTRPDKYLTAKQIKNILGDLRDWLGPFRLVFTGAEPLLREDIIEVLIFASQNDIYTVMTTNGWLVDKKMAESLVNSGLEVINISLDGVQAKTHDFLRGKKGAFRRAVRALRLIKKARRDEKTPALYINTVIMEPNVDELVGLVELSREERVDNIRFQALESKYLFGDKSYAPFWFKKNPLWPQDWQRLAQIIEKLKVFKRQGGPIKNTFKELDDLTLYYKDPFLLAKKQKVCFTGVRNFAIDEYGRVKLCFGMNPVGDLLKEKPQDIWYGEKAKKLRQVIARCQRACRILPCNKREELNYLLRAFLKRLRLSLD